MLTRVFVDSSVFLLAAGQAHPMRESARQFLHRCEQRDVSIHVSVETMQEVLFHRLRRGGRDAALAEVHRIRRGVVLHPFDEGVVERMLDLVARTSLRGRDAVHAATALLAGFDTIVSADHDLDGIPGLRRIEPGDLRI